MFTKADSITQAIIPAAGFGSRLRPLTNTLPKELLPVGRKTVLGHVLTELSRAGITRALFIVSERKPQIRLAFGDTYQENDDFSPMACDYLIQTQQRGSGDAVRIAKEWTAGRPFVVAFGDCLIESAEDGEIPLGRLIETHLRENAAATVLVEQVPREKVSQYGVVAPLRPLTEPALDPFALADLVEKPAVHDAPSDRVIAARFALSPAIFDALDRSQPDPRGEHNLPDAMRLLGRDGLPLWAVPLRPGEARRDIGNFASFSAAFVRAALRDPESAVAVRQAIAETK